MCRQPIGLLAHRTGGCPAIAYDLADHCAGGRVGAADLRRGNFRHGNRLPFGKLIRLVLTDDGYHLHKSERIETGIDKPCRLDVLPGPDGYLYYADITTIYRLVRAK